MAAEFPYFPPRQLLVANGHPFHVAATEDRAVLDGSPVQPTLKRYPKFTKFDPAIHEQDKAPVVACTEKFAPPHPFAVCRVLVPEDAVSDDGHCRAIMVIPPGERETRADIDAVARYNRPKTDVADNVFNQEMSVIYKT